MSDKLSIVSAAEFEKRYGGDILTDEFLEVEIPKTSSIKILM